MVGRAASAAASARRTAASAKKVTRGRDVSTSTTGAPDVVSACHVCSHISPPLVATALLEWYGAQRRFLPWRATILSGVGALGPNAECQGLAADATPEETRRLLEIRGLEAAAAAKALAVTPYAIWVSEVMSQQTQLVTVVPYWLRWLRRFPTPAALAAADLDDVRAAWAGLGYYRRAALLHQGAKFVTDKCGGGLPTTAAALLDVPGIGAYTAAAIASVCYREAVPVVDGNVLRVVSRLAAMREADVKSPAVVKQVRTAAEHLIAGCPEPGDFNQALMEVGATVCKPSGTPRCEVCPLRTMCKSAALLVSGELVDIEGVIPLTSKAPKKRTWTCVAVAITAPASDRSLQVLLEKRPEGTGLLAGMWQLLLIDVVAPAPSSPPSGKKTTTTLSVTQVKTTVAAAAGAVTKGDAGGAAVANAVVLPARITHQFSHIDHSSTICVVTMPNIAEADALAKRLVAGHGKDVTFAWFTPHDPAAAATAGKAIGALTVKHLAALAEHLAEAGGRGARKKRHRPEQ
jgi:A/G-specific adenine glycosylase